MPLEFTAIPTEQTTAITDLVLGVLTIGVAASIYGRRAADRWKAGVWTAAFLLLGVASLLGAVAHGTVQSPSTVRLLWQPLYLCLGIALALFVVGAVHDLLGFTSSRRLLPFALGAGVVFYLLTGLLGGSFLLFILYEAVAMVTALGIYLRLIAGGRAGADLMAAGIAITIVAAFIQTRGDIQMNVVWPLDHNGIFHLVQMPGVVALAVGIRSSMSSR